MSESREHTDVSALLKTIVLLLSIGLQACSYLQEVQETPIDPAANAEVLKQRSLTSTSVSRALERYGQSRHDGDAWTMDQLTVAAWTLNTDVAVARADLDAATYATAVAQLPPDPTLNLNLERVVSQAGNSPWVLGAGLGLLLQPGDKLAIRRNRALAQERVKQAQLGSTLWSVCYSVRRAVLDRMLAGNMLDLDHEEIRLRRQYLDWIGTRLDLGAANSQDRLQAAEALQSSESQERLDQLALTRASVQLAAVLGISPDRLSGIDTVLPAVTVIPADLLDNIGQVRDLALVNRLDIRQALAEYNVAEQDLQAAAAGQYPDLGLGPGYLFDQGEHKLTLNTSIPLPLHGSNRARIEQAEAVRTVAARRFDQVQSSALSTIDSNHALFISARASLAAAMAVESVAASALQTARELLDAGAANRGSVLSAQLLLMQRRRDTLNARQMLINAVSDMEDAIQVPLFPPSSLDISDPDIFQEPSS